MTDAAERHGWPPVIAHALVTGVTQILWLTYAPVTTDAARYYGVSSSAITWLANIYPVLYFLLAIPVGRWLDRSPRSALLTGALLTAAGAVIRLVPESYPLAIAGQVLGGIAQPIMFAGIVVIVRANLTEEGRPAGIALGTAGSFAGVIVGLLLPTVLVSGHDFGPLMLIEAAIAVACSGWMLWLLRERIGAHLAEDLEPGAIRRLLADRRVRALATLAFGGFGIFATLLTVFQPLMHPRGIGRETADWTVLAMTSVGVVCAVILPPLVIRARRERLALLGGLPLASIVVLLLGFSLPQAALITLTLLLGVLLLPGLPVMLEAGERLRPADGGTISAIVFLAGNLGVALLTIASLNLDHFGQWLPFAAMATSGLLMLALSWRGITEATQRR